MPRHQSAAVMSESEPSGACSSGIQRLAARSKGCKILATCISLCPGLLGRWQQGPCAIGSSTAPAHFAAQRFSCGRARGSVAFPRILAAQTSPCVASGKAPVYAASPPPLPLCRARRFRVSGALHNRMKSREEKSCSGSGLLTCSGPHLRCRVPSLGDACPWASGSACLAQSHSGVEPQAGKGCMACRAQGKARPHRRIPVRELLCGERPEGAQARRAAAGIPALGPEAERWRTAQGGDGPGWASAPQAAQHRARFVGSERAVQQTWAQRAGLASRAAAASIGIFQRCKTSHGELENCLAGSRQRCETGHPNWLQVGEPRGLNAGHVDGDGRSPSSPKGG